MKVLFALNDESITHAIVKQYTDQYKEIISYKNVYFFNAILKELGKNKTYDRIVISEELEEFSSSSLNQKDKFIFDKLDSISDEAVSGNGTDIPIILICSERRAKSEDILVKLFGIGVYNAIIGDDRTTEEVCRLINKPRSKKEAKMYYKIDSEKVKYEKENDSDVSEIEMQNILRHFKRLGKNEDKYVESFNNIVTQYNKDQLKVIIAILPENVKEVLDAKSEEYCKIVYPNGKKEQENRKYHTYGESSKSRNKKQTKGTSEKLLGENKKFALAKPVIVPSSMERTIYTKVDDNNKLNVNINDVEDDDDDDEIEDDVKNIIENTPKRRGRPRKNIIEKEPETDKPKKRGRPKKKQLVEEDIIEKDDELLQDNIEDFELPGISDEYVEEENDDLENFNNYNNDEIVDEYDDENDYEDKDITEQTKNDNLYVDEYDNEDDDIDYDDDDYEDDDYEEDDDDEENNLNMVNTRVRTNANEQGFSIAANDLNTYSNSFSNEPSDNNLENNDDIYLNNTSMRRYDNTFKEGEIEALLAGDKKVVAFVGTSKNGTSFIINNIAQILSNLGVNVAILDATQNKNAYYIYTKNDDDLRKLAINSIDNLKNGSPQGIMVNTRLNAYTTIPSQNEDIYNSRPILETLIKNYQLVLIDCDFNTPLEYFENSQEIYLVQTMDVLTIQPLTEFLRELKIKNVLVESKIRIILNKMLKIKGITGKSIVGGMSNYNDPEMSFMTELFDRNMVKTVAQIPFDEDVYRIYLESIIECDKNDINPSKYPKEFKQILNNLAEVIYPLLPNNTYNNEKKNKKRGYQYNNSFSENMNNTLDSMRKKY